MEECEICGKNTDVIYVVEVEGAHLNVCEACARGKKIIEKIGPEKPKGRGKAFLHVSSRSDENEEEEIVENYGTIIRKAREKLNLPLIVVAERINEKESTLKRVEEQKTLPSAVLVKKLEKELGIKLMAKQPSSQKGLQLKHDTPITLWDAAEKKQIGKKGTEGE